MTAPDLGERRRAAAKRRLGDVVEARERINKAEPGAPARLALAGRGMWLWDPVPHAATLGSYRLRHPPSSGAGPSPMGKVSKHPARSLQAFQLAFNKRRALGSKEICCFADCTPWKDPEWIWV